MNGNVIFGVRHTIDHFVVAFILTLWILLMVQVNWHLGYLLRPVSRYVSDSDNVGPRSTGILMVTLILITTTLFPVSRSLVPAKYVCNSPTLFTVVNVTRQSGRHSKEMD